MQGFGEPVANAGRGIALETHASWRRGGHRGFEGVFGKAW